MTLKQLIVAVVLAFGASAGLAQPSHATPLLVNGDFETGDLTGWTLTLACAICHGVSVSTRTPYDGNYDVAFGGPSIGAEHQDQLSQHVATTPGSLYLLEFWMMQDSPPCATSGDIRDRFYCQFNNFTILWNGDRVLFQQLIPPGPYLQYQVLVLAVGAVSTLTIDAANDAGFSRFDHVSLSLSAAETGAPSIPEPASLGLAALGLVGVVVFARRR